MELPVVLDMGNVRVVAVWVEIDVGFGVVRGHHCLKLLAEIQLGDHELARHRKQRPGLEPPPRARDITFARAAATVSIVSGWFRSTANRSVSKAWPIM